MKRKIKPTKVQQQQQQQTKKIKKRSAGPGQQQRLRVPVSVSICFRVRACVCVRVCIFVCVRNRCCKRYDLSVCCCCAKTTTATATRATTTTNTTTTTTITKDVIISNNSNNHVQVHSNFQRLQQAGGICGQAPLFSAPSAGGNFTVLANPRGTLFRCESHTGFAKGQYKYFYMCMCVESMCVYIDFIMFLATAVAFWHKRSHFGN